MMPIIKLEVGAMRETILHAFNQRQLDMSEEVRRALDRECSQENIQRIVDETARLAVKEAVSSAVKRWWVVSAEGRKLIDEAVAARMDEEAELYRRNLG